MKKNMILLALTFALATASLAACGTMDNGGTNSGTDSGGNTNSQTQQDAQDKTPQNDIGTDMDTDKDVPDGAETHDNTLTEEAQKMMP